MEINMDKNEKKILNLIKKIERPGIEKLNEFLKSSDYFSAPASTKYHLSETGGLAQHSLNATKLFDGKCKKFDVDISNDSILICGLLHDFCKINLYIRAKKWVKTGTKWNQEEIWSFEETQPLGHGEKSVILLQNYIQLSLQEQAIIRWHMSIFDLSESEKKYCYSAINKFPECVLLFTADFESTNMLENI